MKVVGLDVGEKAKHPCTIELHNNSDLFALL